jgi:ribonuclease-3
VRTGGAGKPSILCGAFEAVAGAVFLDGGWEAARGFCRHALGPAVAAVADQDPKDPKNLLQEAAQARGLGLPAYETLETEGEPHRPLFKVRVQVGCIRATGSGGSKKGAERNAARRALETLERHPDILPGPHSDEAP